VVTTMNCFCAAESFWCRRFPASRSRVRVCEARAIPSKNPTFGPCCGLNLWMFLHLVMCQVLQQRCRHRSLVDATTLSRRCRHRLHQYNKTTIATCCRFSFPTMMTTSFLLRHLPHPSATLSSRTVIRIKRLPASSFQRHFKTTMTS